jgi:hypothetical protein
MLQEEASDGEEGLMGKTLFIHHLIAWVRPVSRNIIPAATQWGCLGSCHRVKLSVLLINKRTESTYYVEVFRHSWWFIFILICQK